jgi:hydrogenase maturation protease
MRRVAIVGVGNTMMGDDGVGPLITQALEGLVENADVIDLGGSGLSAIEGLMDYDVIVIVDAMLTEKEVEVIRLNPSVDEEEVTSAVLDMEYSGSHGLGVQSVLLMLKLMGASPDIYVVGVKPYVVEPRMEISEEMRRALPKVLDELDKVLSSLKIKYNRVDLERRVLGVVGGLKQRQ